MTRQISRREFLRIAGTGAAATAVLTGCGPESRYVVRQPYTKMPEYTYNGQSTFYATTCRECPAGCGIIVRTMQGRALKIEGNADHPISRGKTCSRGQASVQGLYNPDRVQGPVQQSKRGSGQFTVMDWDAAVSIVASALRDTPPGEIAFLLGLAPDHLFDLVGEITKTLGAPPPVRYGAYATFDARATLIEAAMQLFSTPSLPFFDLATADVIFSFGANFLETYLSPVAYARGFARMRRGSQPGRRGYLVQFEPRLSQTAATADEWIPARPGTEGIVALALGRLAAEDRGAIPTVYQDVDVAAAAEASGVGVETLRRLAGLFAAAEHPLAIPGGSVMGQTNGVEAAKAVMMLDVLVGNLGRNGGVFLTPALPVHQNAPQSPGSLAEIEGLVQRMSQGGVKTLFVHGANPLFDLPPALGFAAALDKVPQVISFAPFPDETALQADAIFPDHTALESWGYQRPITGGDRPVISGSQPVVVPFHSTRATADVLIGATQAAGKGLPYNDEVAFIQQALGGLVQVNGFFNAPDISTFMAQFQQHGGWWPAAASLEAPGAADALSQPLRVDPPATDGDGEYNLIPFLSPLMGDGAGANKPWLQETPDPMTTVMWNTWVEINPATADKLGLQNDDLVKVISPYGEIEAAVYRYPAIRPDVIAIPFGQGHTAYGRYAEGRGANPAHLLGLKINVASDLAFAANKVRIEKTGRQRQLSRLESRLGVYGEGLGGQTIE